MRLSVNAGLVARRAGGDCRRTLPARRDARIPPRARGTRAVAAPDGPFRAPRLPARAAELRGPGADRPPVRGSPDGARLLRHPRHRADPDLDPVPGRPARVALVPGPVGRAARAVLRGLRRVDRGDDRPRALAADCRAHRRHGEGSRRAAVGRQLSRARSPARRRGSAGAPDRRDRRHGGRPRAPPAAQPQARPRAFLRPGSGCLSKSSAGSPSRRGSRPIRTRPWPVRSSGTRARRPG